MPRLVPALLLAALAPALAAGGERGPVRSMLELRHDRVMRQGWDLSCGAAALATLLTYDLGDPVAEGEIVAALLQSADAKKIRKRGGFTLLDLKRYAAARGYAPAGYGKLTLATLAPLAPAIVATRQRGEPHFMVFRGFAGDRVLLADPAFGNRTMRVAQFEGIWEPRVAFVVRRPGAPAAPPAADAARAEVAAARAAVPPRQAIGVAVAREPAAPARALLPSAALEAIGGGR